MRCRMRMRITSSDEMDEDTASTVTDSVKCFLDQGERVSVLSCQLVQRSIITAES